jgi:hypothetical protein
MNTIGVNLELRGEQCKHIFKLIYSGLILFVIASVLDIAKSKPNLNLTTMPMSI